MMIEPRTSDMLGKGLTTELIPRVSVLTPSFTVGLFVQRGDGLPRWVTYFFCVVSLYFLLAH